MNSIVFVVKNSSITEYNGIYEVTRSGRCTQKSTGQTFDATTYIERLTSVGKRGTMIIGDKKIKLKRENYNDIISSIGVLDIKIRLCLVE